MVTTADQYDIIIPSGNRFLSFPFNIMAIQNKTLDKPGAEGHKLLEDFMAERIQTIYGYLNDDEEMSKAEVNKLISQLEQQAIDGIDDLIGHVLGA